MPALAQPLPAIRPITDLRTRLNEVCEQARETQEPIVLTKNGSSAFVLMDSSAFDEQQRRNRLALALREAEIEQKYRPEAIPEEEANERMAQIFASWGLTYA
ncbi:MAG: type II toxin-antitoxin system Phd/YefM family antitoxin [Coriobacteriia bacterium]|nr:type II toxin-antitoxin system Phd/YefM family antitoxin [Coriobacteriia bacterium]